MFALWSGARRVEDNAQVMARVQAHPKPSDKSGNRVLISCGVKMFMDGSGGARTVSIKDALRSYTIWAAHQLFLEDRIGSIEAGKDADLAVWDRDMLTIPADALKDLKCQLTIFRGKIVYGKM